MVVFVKSEVLTWFLQAVLLLQKDDGYFPPLFQFLSLFPTIATKPSVFLRPWQRDGKCRRTGN